MYQKSIIMFSTSFRNGDVYCTSLNVRPARQRFLSSGSELEVTINYSGPITALKITNLLTSSHRYCCCVLFVVPRVWLVVVFVVPCRASPEPRSGTHLVPRTFGTSRQHGFAAPPVVLLVSPSDRLHRSRISVSTHPDSRLSDHSVYVRGKRHSCYRLLRWYPRDALSVWLTLVCTA